MLGSTYTLTPASAKLIHLGEDTNRRGNPEADGWSSGLFASNGLNNKPAGGLKRFISNMFVAFFFFLFGAVIYLGLFATAFSGVFYKELQIPGEDGLGFSKIDEQEKKGKK